jgi:hypothetical protein
MHVGVTTSLPWPCQISTTPNAPSFARRLVALVGLGIAGADGAVAGTELGASPTLTGRPPPRSSRPRLSPSSPTGARPLCSPSSTSGRAAARRHAGSGGPGARTPVAHPRGTGRLRSRRRRRADGGRLMGCLSSQCSAARATVRLVHFLEVRLGRSMPCSTPRSSGCTASCSCRCRVRWDTLGEPCRHVKGMIAGRRSAARYGWWS